MEISKKQLAAEWFRELRNRICVEFEAIEASYSTTPPPHHPITFTRTTWNREDGPPSPDGSGATSGGGEMSLMHGNVFEKVGANISTVHGEFSETMRKEIPGAAEKPYFWASGISLVAHMRSPLVPAVHMNTRMIAIGNHELGNWGTGELENITTSSNSPVLQFPSSPSRLWFGGGADLTPMIANDQDTADFHGALKACCDTFDPEYYPKYKKWCDEYFFLKHRNEPRGAGGIFYDYVNTGDWEKGFAFTQAVGNTFLEMYPTLVRRHMHEKWTQEQREAQLKKRGRYVEFNLLYDRGTRFGLMTGGNVEAILMSLPPEVKWP